MSDQQQQVTDVATATAEAVTPGSVDDIAAALKIVESHATPEEAEPPKAVEAAPAEAPPAEDPMAERWAAVKKAEAKIFEEKRAIAEARKAADAEKGELERLRNIFKEDPLKALKEFGYEPADITNRILEGGPSPDEVARKEAAAKDAELQATRKRLEELEAKISSKEADEIIAQYRSEVSTVLAGDEFELLRAFPHTEDEVLELAQLAAREHNQYLTPHEAAVMIQDELRARIEPFGKQVASNPKLRAILGLTEPAQPSDTSKKSTVRPQALTNDIAATPAPVTLDSEPMSEWEQIRAAAKLIGPEAWRD